VSLMFGAPYAADVIGDMITSEPAGTQMPQEPETSLSSVVLHTWADDEMISIYEQGSWTTHAVYLTLEGADDTIANVQYCINDSACSDFEEKLVIEEEGEHFVKIKIADINDDERELWLTVKIDKTAPTLSQSLKNKYASGSLAASGVSVSSEDFSAQIDDVSSVAELEAFEKQHGACYYGWYMGQTGRDMAVRALQAKEWISNSSADRAVEADDTLSKIKTVTYTVNGKEYSSNEAAFKISNLPNGIYKVVITAYDEAGNSASQTVSIKKDSTVPKTKVVASVANGGFSSSAVEASIKSSNSAGVGGLWYSFEADNGSSGSFGYHGVGEKYTFDRTQTVTFTSYSQSGLIGSTVSYKITIDTDKPGISIMARTDPCVAGYVEEQTSPIKEAYFTHNGVKTVIEPYGDGLVGNFNIVLQSGENVIEIFVKDSAGNVNTYSETITI